MVINVKVWWCSGMVGSRGTWNMKSGGEATIQLGGRLAGRNRKVARERL